MDICHLKNAELEPKSKIFKGRVVLRNDIVIDDSGASAVFTEHRWSAVQMAAAKVMDVIARLPDCDGQTADAASAYTQVKSEDASRLLTIPKSECPDVWIRLPRHKWPNSWAIIEDGTFRTKFIWTPIGRIGVGKTIRGNSIGTWMEKRTKLGLSFCSSESRIIFIGKRGWHKKMVGKKQNMAPGGRNWWKHWSWRTNFISWSRKLGMYSTWMQTEWNYFWGIHKDVWITYFCWSNWKVARVGKASRKVCGTVLRRGRTCSILRWAKLWIGKQESGAGIQSFKSLLGWSPIQTGRTWISWRIITSLLTNCLKTVCTCHELEDQTFCGLSTNLQEQSQKWTQACDRRLARLISYIHHTYEFRQYCHVGNTAQHCLLGLCQDSDFAGDLEDSKIYFGWSLVYLWKPNIYPHQLDVQEKQTSVSANNTARRGEPAQGDLCGTGDHSINKNKTKTPTERRKRDIEQLSNVDYVPSNTHSSEGESQLYIFEHNEAVIKMIIKGRSPTMRHVSRTHRVALDWLFDRINSEPKIQINCVDTKNQLADMLTKAHFTRDEWNHLVRLFNIMSFSMFSCSHFSNFLSDPIEKQSAMSKRGQETSSSEGSPMAEPKPTVQATARPVNLVLRSPWSTRENLP